MLNLPAGHTPASSKGLVLLPLFELHLNDVRKDFQEVLRTVLLHCQQWPYVSIMPVFEAVIFLLLM
jgi:hypothetical protein